MISAGGIHSPVNSKQIRVILFNMWYRPEDWFLDYSVKETKPAAAKNPADFFSFLAVTFSFSPMFA